MSSLPLLLPVLSLGLSSGCGSGGDTGDSGTATFCADAPVVTWHSWGQGFTIEACQSCHASTAVDRNGAPWTVQFDSEADVVDQADRILARAAGDSPTMPPSGGVSDDDRQRLEIWLRCWLEAP